MIKSPYGRDFRLQILNVWVTINKLLRISVKESNHEVTEMEGGSWRNDDEGPTDVIIFYFKFSIKINKQERRVK